MFSAKKRTLVLDDKKKEEIMKREMTGKKKVIRAEWAKKVQERNDDGKVEITCAWNLCLPSGNHRISFSRDNLHVWVDGKPVNSESYISDKGYDLDLFFSIGATKGHIYSDVEGTEMMNYILIDGEIKGQEYKQETTPK